jgi:benzaldehyde dehydrogenase (NAD)
MSDLSMLINGLKVSAEKGATFERRNPLDGSVATRAPAASPADAVMAVEAAAEAFKTWSETGPGMRRALLLKAADALEAKTPQFIEAVAAETGASGMWAGFNVMLAAGMIREAAALTTQITGEVIPSDVPGNLAMGLRQPAGVVLGIAPWNAPVILGVRAIAVPLACGNTVIFKGSENCPRTHQLIAEAFVDAGFPPGVVNYITNAPADAGAVVEAMVAHPAVRRQDHCDDLREIPQACGAGAGRQGAAGDSGRRQHRRRGQCCGFRQLCQQRPDLHVDRAHHRGPKNRRRVCEKVCRQGQRAASG